jgi:hypothetical protein
VPLGLNLCPAGFHESGGLFGSSDSSYGKAPRPHGGHVIVRCNGPVLWSSKAFKTSIPTSTAEAETSQASRATKDLIYVKALGKAAKRPAMGPGVLLIDNAATRDHVLKEGPSHRTRHFERATMLVKWAVLKLVLKLYLVETASMIADIFTKAVDKDTFLKMRNNMLNLSADETVGATYARAARAAESLRKMLGRLGGV